MDMCEWIEEERFLLMMTAVTLGRPTVYFYTK